MMKIVLVILISAASSMSLGNENRKALGEEYKKACAAEIAAAGCQEKEFGRGLLRCIHAYQKAHKDMILSDSCTEMRSKLSRARQAEKFETKKSK